MIIGFEKNAVWLTIGIEIVREHRKNRNYIYFNCPVCVIVEDVVFIECIVSYSSFTFFHGSKQL
jgi:hypothetical protein